MSRAFYLILFVSLVSATPPILSVQEHNSDLANYLENNIDESTSKSASLTVFGQSITVRASADIVGPSVMVDDLTYPLDELSMLFSRGYYLSHLACNKDNHPTECDLDEDGCVEFEENATVEYDMEATFTFRNVSISVPFSSTVIPVPEEILEEMKTSSGAENLTVAVEGSVVFAYFINDEEGPSCSEEVYKVSRSISIASNRSFAVGGQQKLFFLQAPILREQLASNNHFDVILLTQCPIYFVEFGVDGSTHNFTIKNFSIFEEDGVERIRSGELSLPHIVFHGQNITTPTSLEKEDYSFAYVYTLNFTYIGVGEHNLSIRVIDEFLESAEYNETILSREISLKNTEGNETTRPNTTYPIAELNIIGLGAGFIAIVILVISLRSWFS
jgi:hypothetical protein